MTPSTTGIRARWPLALGALTGVLVSRVARFSLRTHHYMEATTAIDGECKRNYDGLTRRKRVAAVNLNPQ